VTYLTDKLSILGLAIRKLTASGECRLEPLAARPTCGRRHEGQGPGYVSRRSILMLRVLPPHSIRPRPKTRGRTTITFLVLATVWLWYLSFTDDLPWGQGALVATIMTLSLSPLGLYLAARIARR
jgi:hypothetical protein